jgi:hypothetical protein
MKEDAKISDNVASDGGGVRINQDEYSTTSFTMEGNAEVSGNRAIGGGSTEHGGNDGTGIGGGVWVRHGGTFTLEGGTVEDNEAIVSNSKSLYVQSGAAKWGANSTAVSGGNGSTTPGGTILSSTNSGTNDKLIATGP